MYLVETKSQIIKALRDTLDSGFPDPEWRNMKVEMQFPVVEQDYPSIWFDFDPTGPLSIVGIGHDEFVAVGQDTKQLYRWRFSGKATFTAVALTSYERDRLIDVIVSIFAFSRAAAGSPFRTGIEGGQYVALNGNFDEIDQIGFAASPGTPWATDDMVYEGTLALDIIGEFISTPEGTFFPVSGIEVVEWVLDVESDPWGN